MSKKKLTPTFTEAEAKEVISLINEELGDPLYGRNERLIRSARKKIQEAPLVEE
jgi:hypothetical protein